MKCNISEDSISVSNQEHQSGKQGTRLKNSSSSTGVAVVGTVFGCTVELAGEAAGEGPFDSGLAY